MIGSCMVLDKQHVIMVNTCGIVGMRGVGRCIGLYALVGFVVLPQLVERYLPDQLRQRFGVAPLRVDAWVNLIQPVVN